MKIETNENLLVNVSVMGSVCQPNFQGLPAEPYRLDSDGIPFLLPTWGSIVPVSYTHLTLPTICSV